MCGLFGLIGSKLADADELACAFALLAALNTERGEDSWGVWHGVHVLARTAGTPRDAFRLAREALHNHPTWPLCGHTRLATRGEPGEENAHPFCYHDAGNVRYVAAHNGCVRPDVSAPEAVRTAYEQRAVDSDAFFASMFLHNAHASAWEGWGTFVWTAQAKARGGASPTVHIGCGASFELAVVTIRAGGSLATLWSSELAHLRDAVRVALRSGAQATWHTMSPGYWHLVAAGPVLVTDRDPHNPHYDFENVKQAISRFSDSWLSSSSLWCDRRVPGRGGSLSLLARDRDEGDDMSSKVWPEYVPVRRRRRRRNK